LTGLSTPPGVAYVWLRPADSHALDKPNYLALEEYDNRHYRAQPGSRVG